jgi:hypothetical protein
VLRPALLALALIACVLLAVSEFTDLNEIRILTVTREGVGVGSHHGYALLIIGIAGAVMAYGAYRGSRPAALALAILGAAAVLVVLLVDLPDVDATGLYGRDYEQAKAQAVTGFYLETAGAILLLLAGVLTVVLNLSSPARPRRERPDVAAQPPAA